MEAEELVEDHRRWSEGPHRAIPAICRDESTCNHTGESGGGSPSCSAVFQTGEDPCHSRMTLSHVKKPSWWRAAMMWSGRKKACLEAIGSMPRRSACQNESAILAWRGRNVQLFWDCAKLQSLLECQWHLCDTNIEVRVPLCIWIGSFCSKVPCRRYPCGEFCRWGICQRCADLSGPIRLNALGQRSYLANFGWFWW